MILNHLSLRNYKQYAELELEFREGLVGVIGKNGAGKSTIFEAILYCLFGRDESNKALVRSSFATDFKSPVELELAFSLGEIRYRVKRDFRGKAMAVGAELYKNDELIAKGVSAVNEEIVKLLHMERDAFKRSVFSGQKELSELSDTSGEARKRMVRKMLGLDTLDEVQARVGADMRDLNNRAAGQRLNLLSDEAVKALEAELKTGAKTLQAKRSELKRENENLRKTEKEYQTQKQAFEAESIRLNQHHALERMLAQARERHDGLMQQQQALMQKLDRLRQQKKLLDEQLPAFQAFENRKKQLRLLEAEKQKKLNYDTVLARLNESKGHLQEVESRLAALKVQLADREKTETAVAENRRAQSALEKEMELKRNELKEVGEQISGLNTSIRERSEKLESLRAIGREGACPTCLQPLLDGYEKVVAELDRQIHTLQSSELKQLEARKAAVTEAGMALKQRLESLRKTSDDLLGAQSRLAEIARQANSETAQLQKFSAGITRDELILHEIGTIHFEESDYHELNALIGSQESQFVEFQSSVNYVNRELPETEKALTANREALSSAASLIEQKSGELAALAFDPAAFETVKAAFSGFDEAYSRQSAIVRQLDKACLELESDINRGKDKLALHEQIKVQIADKLQEVELLSKLAEHLGSFKTEILEKVSPGISREASGLFSRITKGKYESIRVDENFDFSIADGGQYYPIERFSGGEVDLANFCLRIAVTRAIMDLSGSGHRLEFLAFDEIFGSQDEERRMEMMLALNYLQEQFRQIYIVSHIDSLQDYFPNLLEVQAAPDGSRVQWR